MLWAEEQHSDNTVWYVAALPVAMAVGGGLYKLLDWWASRKREDHKTTMDEWRELVANLTEQNRELRASNSWHREQAAGAQRVVVYLHAIVTRQAEVLREKGMPVEPVLTLRELGVELTAMGANVRQMEQNAALIDAETLRLTGKDPKGGPQ